MFTIEQRDARRDRVLRLAQDDARIVAGAALGSLALGGGDRFSDLDLTFGVADAVPVSEVLDDWTRALAADEGAVQLTDLHREPTIYRVFLLPDALQFDFSLTPAERLRPAGPRWRTLFGATTEGETHPTPPDAHDLFGWGVIYALHSRSSIERRRVWQAAHYVGAVRDHALALACLREGLSAVQARGYDELAPETLARFADTHARAPEPATLRGALAAAVRALLREGTDARLPHAAAVADRLADVQEYATSP